MNSVYNFLFLNMNKIIIIAGISLIALIIGNYLSIRNHYIQIKSIMNWKNTTTKLNRSTREIEDESEDDKATPDSIRKLETDFNKTCSWHDALAALIPLFPLFGILGTVSGLIPALKGQNIETLFDSLKVALESTFYGLVFAIILKFIDSLFPARRINDTEVILEDYEKKLNNAIMLGNITD